MLRNFLINCKISTNLCLMLKVFSEPLFVKMFANLPILMCGITNVLHFGIFIFTRLSGIVKTNEIKYFCNYKSCIKNQYLSKFFIIFFFWQIFEFSNMSFESRSKTKPSTSKIWIQVPKLELIEVCRHFDESLVSASKNSIDV